jgi:hypothetical protein
MGFGLDIKETPDESKDDGMVSYKGVYVPLSDLTQQERAWVTMKERGYKSKETFASYNRPKKNKIRDEIKNKILQYNCDTILTLETNEYLLPKLLPDKQFFVAQNDKEEFLKMIKSKPDNVFLIYGDISEFSRLKQDFDCIWIDSCSTYRNIQSTIKNLNGKISLSKLIGITICGRKNHKDINDWKFDIVNKLQDILNIEIELVYVPDTYKDEHHAPMFTLFFKPKLECKNGRSLPSYKICKKCGTKFYFDDYKKLIDFRNEHEKRERKYGWKYLGDSCKSFYWSEREVCVDCKPPNFCSKEICHDFNDYLKHKKGKEKK